MPHGCVISIPAIPDSHRCIRTSVVALGVEVCHIHIGVGLLRCSFRLTGQFPGASNREASDSAGLHAFFMP